LEHAYQLITGLDKSRESFFHRTGFKGSSKTTTTSKSNHNQPSSPRVN